MEVKTPSGVYRLVKPVGRIGAKHMAILMRLSPEDMGGEGVSIKSEKVAEVFEQWATQVLPHIIVSGPYRYEEMPGEDQFIVFMKMIESIQLAEEYFQGDQS